MSFMYSQAQKMVFTSRKVGGPPVKKNMQKVYKEHLATQQLNTSQSVRAEDVPLTLLVLHAA